MLLDTSHGILAYVSGNLVPLELPREFDYLRLILDLDGAVTISGGTTSGTVVQDGPQKMIERIQVIVDGRTIKDLDGEMAYYYANVVGGTPPAVVGLSTGDAGTYPIRMRVPIYWQLPRAVDSEAFQYRLPGRALSELRILVTFASGFPAALISGGDRTITFSTTPNVRVSSIREDALFLDSYGLFFQNLRTVDITATGNDLRQQLTAGASTRSLTFLAIDNSVRDDDIIAAIRTVSGGLRPFDNTWRVMQRTMEEIFELEAIPVGVMQATFDREGEGGGLLDLQDATAELFYDVDTAPTGTANLSFSEARLVRNHWGNDDGDEEEEGF